MRKKVISIIEVLHGVLILITVTAALAGIVSVFIDHNEWPERTLFIRMLSVFIPFAVTWAAKRYLKSFFTFLMASIASAAVTFLIPMPAFAHVVVILLSFAIFLGRMNSRNNGTKEILESPNLLIVIFFGLVFIIASMAGDQQIMTVSYYCAFIYAMLAMIHMNFSRLEEFLNVNVTVSNVPEKQIGRTNNWMLILYLILMAGVMIVLPLTGLETLLAKIGNGLKQLLGYLLSLFGQEESPPVPPEPLTHEEQPSMPEGGSSALDLSWLRDVFEVVLIIVGVVALCFLLYALIRAFIDFVKRFYRPNYKSDVDEEEFINETPEEKVSVFRKFMEERGKIFDFSPNAVVRRTYKRSVNKAPVTVPGDELMVLSPTEIEDAVQLAEGRDTLHRLYEKARYSKDGCDKDDAKLAKKEA